MQIRVMTWNVWWRFGGNWREREPGLVEVVSTQHPDLIGVQECWGADDRTQADVLAESIGASAAFIRVPLPPEPTPVEEPSRAGAVMGLGLVSRWPIRRIRAEPLPSEGRELSALVADVDHPDGDLRVVVGVTSWEPEREDETRRQVDELQRLTLEGADGRSTPSILLADLNYDTTQTPLQNLRLRDGWEAAPATADPRTLSSANRFAPPEAAAQYERRIDHVLFAPGLGEARATAARIARDEPGGIPPSDHYPVIVDLEWASDR